MGLLLGKWLEVAGPGWRGRSRGVAGRGEGWGLRPGRVGLAGGRQSLSRDCRAPGSREEGGLRSV